MPLRRVGYGSDFVIKNQNVGIGTTNPTAKLQVGGTLKGELNITGVSDFASYNGFVGQKQNVSVASTIGFTTTGIGTFTQPNERETGFLSLVGEYNTVSEDLIVDEGKIFEISTTNITGITTLGTQEVYAADDSVVSVGTLESVSIQSHFSVPDGGINDRPDQPTEGMVRFNDDLNTLEFYNGIEWRQFTVSGASGRAVFAGGYTPTSGAAGNFASVMDYVNISTKGNAVSFGEMHAATYAALFGFSSATRGVFGGGYKNATATSSNNDVAYITIASEGNTIDFGDLNHNQNWGKAAASSSTRGLAMGGFGTNNVIDYVEINTTGSFLDFGDLAAAEFGAAGMGSPTKALTVGGGPNGIISAITIASRGNAVDWGRTGIIPQYYTGGGSNSVRGLFNKTRETTTQVHSIIIASSGSVDDFGNLTSTIGQDYPGGNGNCASQTTLLFAGGGATGSAVNTIETISITTAGNATDFGDLTTKRGYMGACSDSHGGLGGF